MSDVFDDARVLVDLESGSEAVLAEALSKLSTSERVRAVLIATSAVACIERRAARPMGMAEIAAAAQVEKHVVRSPLSRLCEEDVALRQSRGLYYLNPDKLAVELWRMARKVRERQSARALSEWDEPEPLSVMEASGRRAIMTS